MTFAVWRVHLFSCGWPAKHDHMGFPRKGAGKPRGCISKFYSKLYPKSPVSLRCSAIIMSVTDSKTNCMLLVSVAHVT